jgi:hypothetical protein
MDAKTAKALREAATPGPYVAYPVRHDERDGEWIIDSVAPQHVLIAAGRSCGADGLFFDDCVADGIRCEADARLFAAAPDLASAVEHIEAELATARATLQRLRDHAEPLGILMGLRGYPPSSARADEALKVWREVMEGAEPTTSVIDRLRAEVEEWRRRAMAAEAANPVDTAPTCG